MDDAVRLMQETRHNGFPVVDRDGFLVGVIALEDVRKVDADRRLSTPVRAVMTNDPVVATPGETLEEIFRRFAIRAIGRIPVIEGGASRKVVGVITRSDIVDAYNLHVLRSEEPEG